MASQPRISVVVLAAVMMLAAGCTESGEPPNPRQTTTTSARPMPSNPDKIQEGETYRTRAGRHCGLEFLTFAGREWKVASPHESLQLVMGPVPVQITYVDSDTLRLTVDEDAEFAAGVSAIFRPTDEDPPPCI